jgi:magnesium-protoporphyrin IX monomethyl ester (oxidative) cyclase
MKICLVEPGLENFRYQSLGILYIASVLEENGHKVSILNYSGGKIEEENLRKTFHKIQPEIVGVSVAFGATIGRAIKISKIAKEIGCIVVWGGNVATSLWKSIIKENYVDIVVIGEGEYTMLELCKKIEKKEKLETVKGIVFKINNKIIRTEKREPIQNLDKLPMPAWHLVDVNKYACDPLNYVYICGSRGCYYRCSHCYNRFLHYNTVRFRSPKKIVDEIAFLRKKYGIRLFNFADNDFTCNRKWVEGFCKEMIKRKINVNWTCQSRIRDLDRKILLLMKKAGCIYMFFGVESASPKILKLLNRNQNIEKLKDIINNCNKLGIFTKASFIVGIPTDNVYELKKTIRFAEEIKPTEYCVFWYSPIPGTPLFEISKKYGLKEPRSLEGWSKIDFFTDHNLVKSKAYKRMAKKFIRKTSMKAFIAQRLFVLPRLAGFKSIFVLIEDFIHLPQYLFKLYKSNPKASFA